MRAIWIFALVAGILSGSCPDEIQQAITGVYMIANAIRNVAAARDDKPARQ